MRKSVISLTLVGIMLMAGLAMGQEKLSVSESLKWMPDGVYIDFGNYNVTELKKAPSFKFFEMLMNEDNGSLIGQEPPLPKSIKDKVEYISYARTRIVGSEDEVQALEAAIREKGRAISVKVEKSKNGKGKKGLSEKDQEELDKLTEELRSLRSTLSLWVYKIADLPELMAKELKNGTFARIGKRLYKKPVFSFNAGTKGKSTNKSKNFAYATDTGELLICKDYEILKAMVKSGLGAASNIFDNQEYTTVSNFLVTRGQAWKVEPKRYLNLKEIEKLRAKADVDDSKLEAREEAMEKTEVFKISNMILSEDVIMQNISVFNNSAAAEAHYNMMNNTFKQTSQELKNSRKDIKKEISNSGKQLSAREEKMVNAAMGFAGNLLESQKTVVEDSVVTTSIVFGQKQQRTLTMLMGFAKMMEQKEEAKEKREEERNKN